MNLYALGERLLARNKHLVRQEADPEHGWVTSRLGFDVPGIGMYRLYFTDYQGDGVSIFTLHEPGKSFDGSIIYPGGGFTPVGIKSAEVAEHILASGVPVAFGPRAEEPVTLYGRCDSLFRDNENLVRPDPQNRQSAVLDLVAPGDLGNYKLFRGNVPGHALYFRLLQDDRNSNGSAVLFPYAEQFQGTMTSQIAEMILSSCIPAAAGKRPFRIKERPRRRQ